MASNSTRKSCGDCKQFAAVNCEGCSRAFCVKHLLDHRNILHEEMNNIVVEHDQLHHILDQQRINSQLHPLIKRINQWEEESIEKIQHKAKQLREELLQHTVIHTNELLRKLRQISEKILQTQTNQEFIESDLRHWKISIEELKANLTSPTNFNLNTDDAKPLVSDISINILTMDESFDRISNENGIIEEQGKVAQHDSSKLKWIEIRGKNLYTTGHHRIRLLIERSLNEWLFLGINSQSTPLYDSLYNIRSVYGWASTNYTWVKGQTHPNRFGSPIEMCANDQIELIIDCDYRRIFMINERTNTQHQLDVNIDFCPFPWQLCVNLLEPNSRIRILSSSSKHLFS